MCWEDVKIGQATTYQVSTITVDNAVATQIVGSNPYRVGLWVLAPPSDALRIAPGLIASPTVGQVLPATGVTDFYIRLETHGRIVQDLWSACVVGAAPLAVQVIEFFNDGLGREVGPTRGQ